MEQLCEAVFAAGLKKSFQRLELVVTDLRKQNFKGSFPGEIVCSVQISKFI